MRRRLVSLNPSVPSNTSEVSQHSSGVVGNYLPTNLLGCLCLFVAVIVFGLGVVRRKSMEAGYLADYLRDSFGFLRLQSRKSSESVEICLDFQEIRRGIFLRRP